MIWYIITFIIGLFIGSILGIVMTCLMYASKERDERDQLAEMRGYYEHRQENEI